MKNIERARKRTDVERRLKQADRLARVLRILQMIPGRARWNVKDMAAELECSERTIRRDLVALGMAGIHAEFDKEANCYRIDPSFRYLPGRYLILIEAKFTSPNPFYTDGPRKDASSLTKAELLEIYQDPTLQILGTWLPRSSCQWLAAQLCAA